ncbi:hypothetical protein FN846DRAFT_967255 [Sphaerosporella brunnea]|uniref:Uncharacterized protein n=1 Tax=Sphaerosporella brunnea TaxID=1250544 RepID=A0A5J5ELN7_9PEZI|nr:hypothetical protein FN846DRAFT_967255 [Sphaerosporella brunnea]
MAEAFGIAVNAVAVVDVAVKASGAVYKYAKSAKNCPKTVEQLKKQLSTIEDALKGLQRVAERRDAASKAAGGPSPSTSELSTALSECQSKLLTLIEELECSFRNTILEKLRWRLRWPIKEPKIKEFIASLDSYQQVFQTALQTDIALMTMDVRADVVEVKTDVRQAITDVGGVTTGMQEVGMEVRGIHLDQARNIQETDKRVKREKLSQLVRWLSPLHYNLKHEESVGKHQDGSGTWLFETQKYQDWEKSTSSKLWIHGIPGCGKTILASTIIQRLKERFPADSGFSLAYFYCQFDKEETRDPANVARTLLAQLLCDLDYDAVELALQELVEKVSTGQGPPEDVKLLTNMIAKVSTLRLRFIVVIDGLDESPAPLRRELLASITRLSSCQHISIAVLSRKEVDIADEFRDFPVVPLQDEGVNLKDDMRKLIEDEFKDTRKWGAHFQSMRDEITEALILGSGVNMFRWLQCQLDHLNELETQADIRNALAHLPETLFETYDRILDGIGTRKDRRGVGRNSSQTKTLAQKAFLWLVHSIEPLTLDELVEALAIEEDSNGSTTLDRTKTFYDPKGLLRTCRSLLNYDHKTGIVKLCHYTVEEYLVSDYLRQRSTNSYYAVDKKDSPRVVIRLAKIVLRYLLLEDFSQPCVSDNDLDSRLTKYKFYRWCTFNWFEHIRKAKTEDEGLFELYKAFVFDCPGNLRSYEQIVIRDYYLSDAAKSEAEQKDLRYREERDQDKELSCALFYHTIRHNLRWITRRVLECKPALLNNDFRGHGTPLLLATLANNPEMALDILDLGVDINAQHPPRDLPDITAFRAARAPHRSNFTTYDMLLKYTLDPPERNITARAGTPFEYIIHVASMYAPHLVPDLLTRGFDPNIRAGDGATPVHYAVMGNSLEAIETLVEAGADINAESYSGRTAFHIAVSLRSDKILKYLVENVASTAHEFPPNAFAGIKTKIPTTPHCAGTHIPGNWIRVSSTKSADLSNHLVRGFLKKEPFISITVKHRSLKRIVFKLKAFASMGRAYGTYHLPYAWFEAGVVPIHPPTCTSETKPISTTPRRCIQAMSHRSDLANQFHVVAWDVRDPTPGVKEWLATIRPGDIIGVYPKAKYANIGCSVWDVEMEIYCES